MAKAIGKIVMAILTYLFKYRPYMTVWVTCCVLVGIYEGIKELNIYSFVVCMLFAFVPTVIKKILLTISRIGGPNRYDEKLLGRAPRGRFTNYIEEYLKK